MAQMEVAKAALYYEWCCLMLFDFFKKNLVLYK